MCLIVLILICSVAFGAEVRIPASAVNLLSSAKISSNFESYGKGLRGQPDHMVYDIAKHSFIKASQWHEYGVGFGQDLGVLSEDKPAWWMAQWPKHVEANLIILSAVYPNQSQPDTAWKIELRSEGNWKTHASGIGGWYNTGKYLWGGPDAKPLVFDAIRVSLFSKDDKTSVKSIHLRGEEGISWIVAHCLPIDAELDLPKMPVRAGEQAKLQAIPLMGDIKRWRWDFGDGSNATGKTTNHTYKKPGTYNIKLTFSDDKHTSRLQGTIQVAPPVEARITPLKIPVMVGQPISLSADTSIGKITKFDWDFGDGSTAKGKTVNYVFTKPGIYKVSLSVNDGKYEDQCLAIIRAHTTKSLHIPQVVLDTDQKNEQDDQHYLSYGLFSELDILGVNSIHHGGGQEPINYAEILHIIELAGQSSLPEDRVPFVFRGADQRLEIPDSRQWFDTVPVVSEASEAILAAARGASPGNPVWIVPVGPGTNTASAILHARFEGLELKDRVRIMWLGGSNNEIINEFNGNNDPWSMFVVAKSGIETWIMPAPVGARVQIDKRTESRCYPDNSLGKYLFGIMPSANKALYDPSCLSAIISLRLDLNWIKQTEYVTVAGPEQGYRWTKTDEKTSVRVLRQIDQQAMKEDIFNTIKGTKQKLIGASSK